MMRLKKASNYNSVLIFTQLFMETKLVLLDVDFFEFSNSKQWVIKKWYSNGNLYVYRFSKEEEYLNFVNPLLNDNIVLVFRRHNITDLTNYFNDVIKFDFDM